MLDIVYADLRVIFMINKGKALVIALWEWWKGVGLINKTRKIQDLINNPNSID